MSSCPAESDRDLSVEESLLPTMMLRVAYTW
jgi:hypothetical protein